MRILHLWCGLESYSEEEQKKRGGVPASILLFFLDACYMTAVVAAFSFFIFWTNNGRFRWYMAAGAVFGMAVYFATVGRLVMAVSETVVSCLKRLLRRILLEPLLWFFGGIGKLIRAVGRKTVTPLLRMIRRRQGMARTDRIQRNLPRDIRFPEVQEIQEERKR